MNEFEKKIRNKLLMRGFPNDKLINNRGLIGATIDEVILEVVKNINDTRCCKSDSELLACDCDRKPLRYNELGYCKYCGKQKPSEG